MKNTPYDIAGPRLPRELQLKRVRRAMEGVLTPRQRQVLEAVYFQKRRVTDLAEEWGVNKSTISRTLKRAETRLREHLRY